MVPPTHVHHSLDRVIVMYELHHRWSWHSIHSLKFLQWCAFVCLPPCSTGAVLDLPKLLPTKIKTGQLTCPTARSVCPTLGCREACSNGYCWQGKCYCHMEFTGPGCSQSLVPSLVAQKAAQTLPSGQG